eukprot:178668-Rhodomonas_salina.5
MRSSPLIRGAGSHERGREREQRERGEKGEEGAEGKAVELKLSFKEENERGRRRKSGSEEGKGERKQG